MVRGRRCAVCGVLLATLVALGSGGCIGSESKACGATVCAPGKACDRVHEECVDPWQLDACAGLQPGQTCTNGQVEGYHCDLGICVLGTCGDGVVDTSEGCDDGNRVSGDGCDSGCVPERCGNSVVDLGEACDDGNQADGDGCSGDCLSDETCGNGIVDTAAGEACDCGTAAPYPAGCAGANSDAPDADCRSDCGLPGCGDGILDTGEQCDDGAQNSDTERDACRANCQSPSCGDGVCDTGEPDGCRQDCPDWVDVAPGLNHTCGLLDTGAVYCWGKNEYGQLGDTTTTDSLTPVRVHGLTGIADIASGAWHTCAVKDDGTAWCWGMGNSGRLGDGGFVDQAQPVQVSNVVGAVQVAAGSDHTCIRTSGGTVSCWGRNDSGELGDGSIENFHEEPVQVANLTGIVDIGLGGSHSCAVKDDGFPWCWGDNNSYQVLSTSTTDQRTPVRAATNVAGGFTTITGGPGHSCGMTFSAIWCWGANGYGQLGRGTTGGPEPVADIIAPNVWAQVAGFFWQSSTCGVKTDGTAWCWGDNDYGQLGDNSTTARDAPVQVGSLTDVAMVAGGGRHACAVRSADGSIWCWGDNDDGQLGDETTTDRPAPVRAAFVAD